jgi:hypothetical protein
MGRKTFAIAIALITLVAFTASAVEARHGKSAGNSNCNRTQSVGKAGCPFGNTPGSGLSKGFGPGDSTGNNGTQPRDGSGFGAKAQGKGKANNPNCDGTGPKGSAKGRKSTQP